MSCTIFDFGGILMAICYDKLWKLLIDKKMNRTELKEASGISFNVLARLGKNEPVSFESIEKICFTLNCKIEDVVEIQKDEPIQIDSDAFTTIELFAGAGGLALGIEKAGFEPLGLIEFDKDAAESLKTNRPNWRVIHDDIANISCLDLEDYFGIKKGDLDLLSGGAPCQAFSYAGKRLGLEDARGTLFYHYATFLQKLQPKMFLFENVRGLLTHDKGTTYATRFPEQNGGDHRRLPRHRRRHCRALCPRRRKPGDGLQRRARSRDRRNPASALSGGYFIAAGRCHRRSAGAVAV